MTNWGDKTILIAEDEDLNYIFLRAILNKTGVKLLRAKTGFEAIAFIEKSADEIDLVLMDIKMPKMDGIEATKIIKQKYRHIPVIAQTAFALLGEKEKILSVGCDAYIAKPFKKENLISLLNEWL